MNFTVAEPETVSGSNPMDQIGEIILRLKITEFEAQLALRESVKR